MSDFHEVVISEDDTSRQTDSGNAALCEREIGDGFRFVPEWDMWIAWDLRRWATTGAEQKIGLRIHQALTAEHVRVKAEYDELLEEARRQACKHPGQKDDELEDKTERCKKLLAWTITSLNASRIAAVKSLLRDMLYVSLKELDVDPYLITTRNRTINLRTGKHKAPAREDMITQVAPVLYDEEAECPTWEAFVHTAMAGDHELISYLQRLVGYAMTGLTTEHILAFFYGGGRNGKSTFLQVLRAMLGDYACSAPRNLLFEQKGQQHPVELACLYGKRMAVCAEIGEGVTIDEAKVKDLTGGDSVAVRRMRENFWDLIPSHTLFIAGNHKPQVRGSDEGIWRRIRLIPWTVTIPEHAVDRDLKSKLESELDGIFNWCVRGCAAWLKHGLREPQAVIAMTSEYRQDSDQLGAFFGDECTFEPDATVSRQKIREAYEAWCNEDGTYVQSPRRLATRLRDMGAKDSRVREGVAVKQGWIGIRLKTTYEKTCESDPSSGTPLS